MDILLDHYSNYKARVSQTELDDTRKDLSDLLVRCGFEEYPSSTAVGGHGILRVFKSEITKLVQTEIYRFGEAVEAPVTNLFFATGSNPQEARAVLLAVNNFYKNKDYTPVNLMRL